MKAYFYLRQNIPFKSLEQFGFRDAGEFYMWGQAKENSTDEIASQDIIRVDKSNRRLTFVTYGGGYSQSKTKARAKKLYEAGLTQYLAMSGLEKTPDFSGA